MLGQTFNERIYLCFLKDQTQDLWMDHAQLSLFHCLFRELLSFRNKKTGWLTLYHFEHKCQGQVCGCLWTRPGLRNMVPLSCLGYTSTLLHLVLKWKFRHSLFSNMTNYKQKQPEGDRCNSVSLRLIFMPNINKIAYFILNLWTVHVNVIGWTNPDGCTNARTDTLMHAHTPNRRCDNKVELTASGHDKNHRKFCRSFKTVKYPVYFHCLCQASF
jgi:hypothetical protein